MTHHILNNVQIIITLSALLNLTIASLPNTDTALISVEPNSAKQGQWLQVTVAGENMNFFDLDSLGDTTYNIKTVFLTQNDKLIPNESFFCQDKNSLCVSLDIPDDALVGPYTVVVIRSLSNDTLTLTNGFSIESNDVSGVVGHWTFDEGSGDSAYDLSGNGNHLRLYNGAKWVKTHNGYGVDLDGLDDVCKAADSPTQNGLTALTAEAVFLIKQYNIYDQFTVIVDKWGPGSWSDDAWACDLYNEGVNGLYGNVVGGTNNIQKLYSYDKLPLNRWIHLAFVWTNDSLIFYINGERNVATEETTIDSIQNSNSEIRVGNGADENNGLFGIIDDVVLYNYALSPDSIHVHYMNLIEPVCEVNLGIKTHYALPGEEIWVPVYITNFDDTISISSVQFTLIFDTTVVEFIEASIDSGIANSWQIQYNPNFHDSIIFSMGGIGQTIDYGEGELIRCKFKVNSYISNEEYTDLLIINALIDEGASVSPTTTAGKIIVNNVPVIYGDVSGNKEVTAYDGAGIVQYVIGTLILPDTNYPNFTMQIADVSGDQTITSYDAALVFQYSVGLIYKFPVETGFKREKYRNNEEFEEFPDVSLRLVKSPLSTATTLYYELFGSEINGAISFDITIQYDPTKIFIEQGGSITTDEYINLESSVDNVNKLIQLSITTADDFDEEGTIKLATLEVPVPDTSSLEGALFFISGLINEEEIKDLDPLNPTGIALSQSITKDNDLIINKVGLMIHNNERMPVSVKLYDMRGRILLKKLFIASDKVIRIDNDAFSQGLYIYKIEMGQKNITKSFVIRK